MSKLLSLDLEESLAKSPPIYPTGVIHKKRIRIQRALVTFDETQEFRVQGKNISNVSQLKDSYMVNGYIYDEPVQVVTVDPSNKDRFIGIAGYHRDAAQEWLDWEVSIYDVVEFKTPRDRLKFGYTSNHHRPAQKIDRSDILKGIKTAINSSFILDTDDAIADFLKEIAGNETTVKRKSLLDSYRRDNSGFENLESFGSIRANEKALELNIPHLGDKNYVNTGLYGYVKEASVGKQLMADGLKVWLDQGEDIHVTGYITFPTPKTLKPRRLSEKHNIDKLNDFLYQVAAKLTDMTFDEIKKKGKSPFKYNGFLPQVISADPTNGGLPVEIGRVDYDGTPML